MLASSFYNESWSSKIGFPTSVWVGFFFFYPPFRCMYPVDSYPYLRRHSSLGRSALEPKNVGVGSYLLGSTKTLSWSVKRQGIFVLVFVLMRHRRADDRNVDKIWLWSKWCELRIDIQKSYRVTCNPICQRFLLTLFLLYEEINWSITTRKTPANMWNYLSQVIMDPN